MKTQQKTSPSSGGRKLFAVLAVCTLLGLTAAYPYALHYWIYPIAYPVLRESASWPLVLAALAWFTPLFAFEYWALGKYRCMRQGGIARQGAAFCCMNLKHFTVAGLLLLAALALAFFPFMRYCVIPLTIDSLWDGNMWPIWITETAWCILFAAFTFWFLGKRRQLMQAGAEPKQPQR